MTLQQHIGDAVIVRLKVKGGHKDVEGILRGVSSVWLTVEINGSRFMVEAEQVRLK